LLSLVDVVVSTGQMSDDVAGHDPDGAEILRSGHPAPRWRSAEAVHAAQTLAVSRRLPLRDR